MIDRVRRSLPPYLRCISQKRIRFAALLALSGSAAAFAGQAPPRRPPAAAPHIVPDEKPTFVLKQFQAGKPMRMVAYGDMRFTDPKVTSGTNPRVRQWLVDKIALERPEALLLTGDMPFQGARDADWDEYRKETASWTEQGFPIFPTLGNHELYYDHNKGIANYLAAYPNIDGHRYYSALLGSVEIMALDMTQSVGPRSDQARWFIAQLQHLPAQVEFLLILYHTPWVADEQSQLVAGLPTRDALVLRGMLEANLSRIHAKVVAFHGHIHNYERFESKGVEYVITGGGGALPYPVLIRGQHDLYRDPGFPVYNFLTLEVHDHELHATMWKVIDPDAPILNVEVKDRFVIEAHPPISSAQPKSKKP